MIFLDGDHLATMPTAYPVEVLDAICATVFEAAEPPYEHQSSLDPVIHQHILTLPAPNSLPSSYPPSSWPEPVSRLTLINLSRVCKPFYKATRPYVWRRVEIRLPRTWLALVEEITGGEEIVDEQAAELVETSLDEATSYVYALTSPTKELDRDAFFKLRSTIRAQLEKDGPLPVEVLTPPDSRNASPMRSTTARPGFNQRTSSTGPPPIRPRGSDARHKSKSPGRWRVIRAVSRATRSVAESVRPEAYIPMPQDARPGRHVMHLDFNHFRTIGLRRSVGEGVNSRFVTGERLELALKEMPNLITFGATEYMDGALTFPVLAELLFRGRPMKDQQREPSRRRNPSPDEVEFGPNDWHRRKDAQALEALDLCGCVSSVFVKALTDFVIMYLIKPDSPEDTRGRGPSINVNIDNDNDDDNSDNSESETRGRRFLDEEIYFPRLKRLCLRSVSSVASSVLMPFIMAFPSLTHLDLSGTRCPPELLYDLARYHDTPFVSLSLGRCPRLTGDAIKHLLIHGGCTFGLKHLSLFGDITCPSPLTEDELELILIQAPCIKQGRLTYLDLSSNPVTPSHLLNVFPPQPALRSLGLSFIAELPLPDIATFLLKKASNVEIITLSATSPQLAPTAPTRQNTIALHSQIIQPLCTVPFKLRPVPGEIQQAPTKLRVIELQAHILTALGGGAGSWRVVRSKGARGWYVDTGSGWTAEDANSQPVSQSQVISPGFSALFSPPQSQTQFPPQSQSQPQPPPQSLPQTGTEMGEFANSGSIFRRGLDPDHPLRKGLEALSESGGNVSTAVGWHARKMEVLQGHGLLGREDGLYGAMSFAFAG